ncbi:uncharacterized protein LOC111626268 [Centruroides sculpturatus]|uniref:uncharacterized protein LOC111626268 n=1 Tax=Centruroides sculpturatus TaxID=218467 RepID=UPI000C6DE100|nr:uncharacterized protein LOC111626268 [Centruroides sculpturatus]
MLSTTLIKSNTVAKYVFNTYSTVAVLTYWFVISLQKVSKDITRECPQGSICGPLLWNIAFNAFLDKVNNSNVIAYADDVLILLGGRSRADLELKGNHLLNDIFNWGPRLKLHFNPNKTKAIVFNKSGQLNLYLRVPHIKMNNTTIKVGKTLKYLGVTLDFRLSWDQHIDYIANRTRLIFQAFSQVAKNKWGPSSNAMNAVYDCIYLSIVTYACGTWGWAVRNVHPKRKLISSQRRALLNITKAFRTAPNRSIQVIARKPPIDLTILQHRKFHLIQRGEYIDSPQYPNIPHCDRLEKPYPFHHTLCPGHDNTIHTNNSLLTNINIYTDGSKNTNTVGCSFVVYVNNQESFFQCYCLHNNCTIFQAELLAIKMAVSWTNDNLTATCAHIHTDSLSASQIIDSNNLHPLATEIRNLINMASNNFIISWVRAHQGNIGNEKADALAKRAAGDSTLPIIYSKLSRQTLRHILWEETLQQWQTLWINNNNSITFQFIPDLKHFSPFTGSSLTTILPNSSLIMGSLQATFPGLPTGTLISALLVKKGRHFALHF